MTLAPLLPARALMPEPNGVLHEETAFPVKTELYFTNFGAIQFLTPDLKPDFVLDYAMLEELGRTARKAA